MASYTSLVLRPLELKLPRSNPLMPANFKTATIAAKTRVNMRPLNPIPPFIGLSTATGSNRRTAAPASISESSSTVPDDGNCNAKPCLDLFFLNFRDAEEAGRNRMEELLSLAWSHNPLTTLKVIYKILLDHHDEIFRTMTIWLHQNHPKTLSCNIEPIAGLFVDFCQFCKLLNVHLVLKDGRQVVEGRFPRIRFETSHDLEQGQDVRQQKQMAVKRYERDPEYRFLHEFISDIFAECLKSDIEKLKHENLKHSDDYDDEKDNWSKITDAATSCLSMGTNFNDPTLLWQSIARKVFPRESYPEYQGVEETDYADSVLDRLRNEVLLPLDKLDKAYESQDSVVEKYLEEVKAGKSKIAPDALLPHQIIRYVNHWNFGHVAELQWKAMVEGIKKQGKLNGKKILNNCLAVCNLRYMFKPGMRSVDASVGFALLMSELNEEPWKGKVIHFSSDPQLDLIKGDELTYRCDFLTRRVPWCWQVDFEKVLDLILEEAVNGNLKPEQVIKQVFVFTDSTDFDNARSNEESDDEDSDNSWKTIYEGIQRKYKEKGYDNAVPHIVYWQMWSCLSDPRWWVKSSEQPGVTMLEGTADNLLKLVLDNGGEISLDLIMEATISGKEYQKLLVVD
ncbi:PREDICTED: LOW QUALITY PROTEIN [Prunus dulcis]|uniref:PREDICTED: LOW QUALITY PROTEIN n=1 Tax=Prunus dulcis TaxID=3755 RepID=A0A5E4FCI1_PRUDU|nr:uncharacterized protein LOC117629072 [Prunus dulcis]VVA25823.1 PREDICTED: LOW QUALITY PROTEIN [Prunus dulcis]